MYSADGTQITLYLDGVGVPVTQSQRALTTEMVKMAYDYFEVVFWAYDTSNNPVVARATWEIGQNAGISGVYRGTDPVTGFYYYPDSQVPLNHSYHGFASLFVGRKTDKILLAAGEMTHVDFVYGYSPIRSGTKSVTFTVNAVTTKLDLDGGQTSFTTAAGDLGDYTVGSDHDGIPYNDVNDKNTIVEKVSLGGVQYPYYTLPKGEVAARYYFRTSFTLVNYIRVIKDGPIKPEVIRREPRFLSGGQYHYVKAKIDTGTDVNFDPAFLLGETSDYESSSFDILGADGIRFTFDTSNSQGGIFSFTFRIPVINMTRIPSTNGGGSYTIWYLQPGFGRDLWALDNGVDAGGCILMGYKAESPGDMIDIFTD